MHGEVHFKRKSGINSEADTERRVRANGKNIRGKHWGSWEARKIFEIIDGSTGVSQPNQGHDIFNDKRIIFLRAVFKNRTVNGRIWIIERKQTTKKSVDGLFRTWKLSEWNNDERWCMGL